MFRFTFRYRRSAWKGGEIVVGNKQIGLNVKIARVKKGMTIQQLAKEAGMSVTTISRLERGASNARIFSLKKIADVLGIDVQTLVE